LFKTDQISHHKL